MPCSARLPVYSLLIAAFIPATGVFGGLIGWQGLAMVSIYLFGILCGLLVTALVSRTSAALQTDLPFVSRDAALQSALMEAVVAQCLGSQQTLCHQGR